jgi:hypothetical protein
MDPKSAQALCEAIFGSRSGEMSMVERCPEACAAFRVAFPTILIGDDRYGALRKDTLTMKQALREWADAVPDDEVPF